jgi:membrane-bound lytic murein transglycosylase D
MFKSPVSAAAVFLAFTLLLQGCSHLTGSGREGSSNAYGGNATTQEVSGASKDTGGNATSQHAAKRALEVPPVVSEANPRGPSVGPALLGRDLVEPLDEELTQPPPHENATGMEEPLPSKQEEKSVVDFELNLRETRIMQDYYHYYSRKKHRTFQRWLDRAEPYLPYIRKKVREAGLPEDLIFLPFAESGFNPWAYSHAGAAGLWQFMPGTGRNYGLSVNWWLDERRNPYESTRAAIEHLQDLYDEFGDWSLVLAAYNAGRGRVSRALSRSGEDSYFELIRSRRYLCRETRYYVPKFHAILKIVRNLEQLGFDPIEWDTDPEPSTVTVDGGTNLLALARSVGMDWSQFRHQNPMFRRIVSPPDQKHTVYLPPDKIQTAQAHLEKQESSPNAGLQRYRVRSGDSWWRLSRRFNVPIRVLKDINNTSSDFLRTGEWVFLPVSAEQVRKARAKPSFEGTYTVRRGDTLWEIARLTGSSVRALRRANGLHADARRLQVGQKLTVPARSKRGEDRRITSNSTYTVRRGDSLWEIARRSGTTVAALRRANDLGAGSSRLQVGQEIKVPEGSGNTRDSREKTREIARRRANYVVRKGESLWEISQRFGVSLPTLVKANGIDNARYVRAGTKLYVPDMSHEESERSRAKAEASHDKLVRYRVRKGDSVWSIARRFGVSTDEILAWNDLTSRDLIHPGDKLKIYLE